MRLDLHTDRRRAVRHRPRHGAETGVNAEGRFIGADAVYRGWRLFWNAPHRRAHAPIDRDYDASIVKGRESSLSNEQLRQIHALRHLGASKLARQLGLPLASVAWHLRRGGSASLRHALAAASVSKPTV